MIDRAAGPYILASVHCQTSASNERPEEVILEPPRLESGVPTHISCCAGSVGKRVRSLKMNAHFQVHWG